MHIDRKTFLKRSALLGLGATAGLRFLQGCTSGDPLAGITGRITGANARTGHLLRDAAQLPSPSSTVHTDVLIVGGGISGLSARRWLAQHSGAEVLLVELDTETGGNARHGRNDVSAYPYGAHYLPVPDLRNTELIDFLHDCGCIESFSSDGLPVYNEYYLCHDPEERLYLNGYWQEGLVPDAGVPPGGQEQIRRFFQEVAAWKERKGNDGLDAFAIPVRNASRDPAFARLHGISFAQYLREQQYTAPHLLWYLEYGCKDDYGSDLDHTSAWAGLHYFAARKGRGANAGSASLLTWPEGNGFLATALKQQAGSGIRLSGLVYQVRHDREGATALCYDAVNERTTAIRAKKVILATPVRVNRRLLPAVGAYSELTLPLRHTPWLIANLTVDGLPQAKGMPLCWDNVFYNTASVGYVNANHQQLSNSSLKVLTCYLPLVKGDPGIQRQALHRSSYRQLLRQVVDELETVHPGITACIRHADLWIWGHGMIAPTPGLMTHPAFIAAARPVDDTIFFAHTDLSGISIFEEAFYQGIHAAKQVISSL